MPGERESRIAWRILILCFLYAALRYMVFGTNAPRQLPAWGLNKALALSSVFALALGIRAWRRGEETASHRYLAAFTCQALLHIILTLALLSPAYYPKLYPDQRLSALGELAVLAGAVSAATLSQARQRTRTCLLGGLLALLAHQAALGAPGWCKPATWPGGLPPITLVGFLLAGLTFLRAAAPARDPRLGNHVC